MTHHIPPTNPTATSSVSLDFFLRFDSLSPGIVNCCSMTTLLGLLHFQGSELQQMAALFSLLLFTQMSYSGVSFKNDQRLLLSHGWVDLNAKDDLTEKPSSDGKVVVAKQQLLILILLAAKPAKCLRPHFHEITTSIKVSNRK